MVQGLRRGRNKQHLQPNGSQKAKCASKPNQPPLRPERCDTAGSEILDLLIVKMIAVLVAQQKVIMTLEVVEMKIKKHVGMAWISRVG